MDTEILLQEFKDSPAGRALIAKAEGERLDKRRSAVETIRVVQQEYDAAMERLASEIEEAEREHGKLQKKFTASILEMNRLGAERRIAAIDFDRVIAVQTDRLKETTHPCIEAAIGECWRKLSDPGLKFEGGEHREKNIWGIFHHTAWTNASPVNERKSVIKKTIELLESMRFNVSADEIEDVARLMRLIPRGPLATDSSQWDVDPEAMRLEVRGKLRVARGV